MGPGLGKVLESGLLIDWCYGYSNKPFVFLGGANGISADILAGRTVNGNVGLWQAEIINWICI